MSIRTRSSLAPAVLVGLLALPGTAPAADAGFAARDLTPPIGVPLAGYAARRVFPSDWLGQHPYAHSFAPSEGKRDAIRAKALWLRTVDADDEPFEVAVVSLDLVGADEPLVDRIRAGLAAADTTPDALLVAATHTHSGPGTLSPNWLIETIATDRFREDVTAPFVAGVVETLGEARDALQPAELATLEVTLPALSRIRGDPACVPEPDRSLRALVARRQGGSEVLGVVLHYAVHGTVLPAENLAYSHDLPGALEIAAQEALADALGGSPVTLFVNGAEGDVAPEEKGDYDAMQAQAEGVAATLVSQLPAAQPLDPVVAHRHARPHLGGAFLSLGNCWAGPSWWGLGVGWTMADDAPIAQLDVGHLRILTVPGEPTTRIGRALRGLPHPDGVQVWVAGLTNGYLGYFSRPGEFGDSIHGCGTLYGPHAGDKLVKAHRCLLGGCP